MVTEEQKFRADTLRILGITLLTPIAKFLLDPYLFLKEHNFVYTICYVFCAVVVGVVGLTQIEIARGILNQKVTDRWKQ